MTDSRFDRNVFQPRAIWLATLVLGFVFAGLSATALGQSSEASDGEPQVEAPEGAKTAATGTDDADTDASDDEASGGDEGKKDDAHAGHGPPHNPNDLSHKNGTDGMEQLLSLDARFELSVATLAIFLVLLAILGKFAWAPLMKALDDREASVAALVEEARQNAEKSRQQLAEYEAKLSRAHQEAADVMEEAKRDATQTAERIVADAQAAAEKERERAVADITTAKNAALGELAEKSVDLAMGLAGNICRKQLQRDDHADLIREAVDRFSNN